MSHISLRILGKNFGTMVSMPKHLLERRICCISSCFITVSVCFYLLQVDFIFHTGLWECKAHLKHVRRRSTAGQMLMSKNTKLPQKHLTLMSK